MASGASYSVSKAVPTTNRTTWWTGRELLLSGILRWNERAYRLMPVCASCGELLFGLGNFSMEAGKLGFQFFVPLAQGCGVIDERANDFAYVCHNHL